MAFTVNPGVASAAQRVVANLSKVQSCWIDPGNHYTRDTLRHVQAGKNGKFAAPQELEEYVAASSALHCFDGWAFLGRGLSACVHGDRFGAIHFAYYAELRASMAILAANGTGVFHGVHVDISTPGHPVPAPGPSPTHDFVRAKIKAWSLSALAATNVASIIHSGGVSLDDWFQQASLGNASNTFVSAWLEQWSNDLWYRDDDHNLRNQASYRVGDPMGRNQPTVETVTAFLRAEWELLRPTAGRFDDLDQFLIRRALHAAFPGASNVIARDQLIDRASNRIFNDPAVVQKWIAFLKEPLTNDPDIFHYAVGTDDIYQSTTHFQILARATLLLRIATGYAKEILSDAAITRSGARVWLSSEVEALGFGDPTSMNDPSDLWNDVGEELQEFSVRSQQSTSRMDWFERTGGMLLRLVGTERVALWGISP